MMMDKWSNRYVHGQPGARPREHVLAERIRNIALILLTVALLGVGIAGGQAIAFRSRCHDTFLYRMQTECSSALSQANSLSRSGGSESSAMLGRIRANIRAIDAINEMNSSLTGGYFVPMATFTELYGIIDSYNNSLKNAVVTIEHQTNLVNALTALQTALSELK